MIEDMTLQTSDTPNTRYGFTLLELLIVVAVISLLVGAVFPAIRMIRRSGELARELSTARQLMIGYQSYAYDNRSMLLPGYYNPGDFGGNQSLPAFDAAGTKLSGGAAYRYPWRLAPYLDYNLDALYLDPVLKTRLKSDQGVDTNYLLSVYPSLGINATFVGGDSLNGGFLADNPNIRPGDIPARFLNFYARRLSDVTLPPQLIVFASARIDTENLTVDNAAVTEGFHKLTAPNTPTATWPQHYIEDCTGGCESEAFGNISLRHPGQTAAIGFFDGHTGTLSYSGSEGAEKNIRDMRHWAPRADRFDWKLDIP
jgi:prepilin-type N-terminal cleavage/methylation domain-containing protein/prepilin-type processing-associated H-X9-DG protein